MGVSSSKIAIFRAHHQKIAIVNYLQDSSVTLRFALTDPKMQSLVKDDFPKISVSTVIIQSDSVNSTIPISLKEPVSQMFSANKLEFNELIIAESVPDAYVIPLENSPLRLGIKYLSLYAYYIGSGNPFKNPCDILPELEELRLELMDMGGMNLDSCKNLKRVWVQGYHTFDSVGILHFYPDKEP